MRALRFKFHRVRSSKTGLFGPCAAAARRRRGPRSSPPQTVPVTSPPPVMTFRTKGHSKQTAPQQLQLHDRLQVHRPNGNRPHHRNRYEKTVDLQQLPPPPPPSLGGPAAIAVAASPAAVAHPDAAGGTPCIYAAYVPRCYVIQKVSHLAFGRDVQ